MGILYNIYIIQLVHDGWLMISWGITQTNVFNCLRQACGNGEVAPREFDVHSRWLTVYQMSSAGSKVAPGTMYEPLA